MYKIEYSKDIEKDLSKLPKNDVSKIFEKIDRLSENPRSFGAEQLQGNFKGLHRIRSGNYRVIYQIIDEKLIILVVKVSHRRQIYRNKS